VSILLNNINENLNYLEIKNVNKIYIPVSEFFNNKLTQKINEIVKKYNVYVYLPVILKENYKQLVKSKLEEIYISGIKGFVVSSISELELIEKFNCEKIANYTFNIFNNRTLEELQKLKLNMYTVSPEMNSYNIQSLYNEKMEKEVIVYGRYILINSEYCPIGTFINCKGSCTNKKIVLKDRKEFEFPIITDKINCNSKIYNSRITSIRWSELNIDSIRIDILDENIEEINEIVQIHKNNKRLEGKEYTNGNLNTEI